MAVFFLLLLAVFGSAVAEKIENPLYFDNLVESTSNVDLLKLLMYKPQTKGPSDCVTVRFIEEPFNEFVNRTLPGSGLQWTQASQVFALLRRRLSNGNFSDYSQICHSRDIFYLHLGQFLYYSCVSVESLIQFTPDIRVALSFVRLFQHLDFFCNVAYQQIERADSWACVTSLDYDDTCYQAFDHSANIDNLCSSVGTLISCQHDLVNSKCGAPYGYYACEDARVSYGGWYCRDLRCTV